MSSQNPWCWCWRCRVRRRRRLVAALIIVLVSVGFSAHEHAQTGHTPASSDPDYPGTTAITHTPSVSHVGCCAGSRRRSRSYLDQLSRHATASLPGGRATRHTRRARVRVHRHPQGALLAAINIGVRTAAQWGSAIFAPTITRQVTGPNTTALLHAEETAYTQLRAANHVRRGQPARQASAAEDGYRFAAWSPATGTVDILTVGPTVSGATVLAATRIQVIWQRGDWRVVAPPGGNWANAATAISSPLGYTIFPGR